MRDALRNSRVEVKDGLQSESRFALVTYSPRRAPNTISDSFFPESQEMQKADSTASLPHHGLLLRHRLHNVSSLLVSASITFQLHSYAIMRVYNVNWKQLSYQSGTNANAHLPNALRTGGVCIAQVSVSNFLLENNSPRCI